MATFRMNAVPLFLNDDGVTVSITGEGKPVFAGVTLETYAYPPPLLSHTPQSGAFAQTYSMGSSPFALIGDNDNNVAVPPTGIGTKFWYGWG